MRSGRGLCISTAAMDRRDSMSEISFDQEEETRGTRARTHTSFPDSSSRITSSPARRAASEASLSSAFEYALANRPSR